MRGIDTTYFRGTEILQLGFLAGHNDTRSKFRDTENIKNASQADEGGFIGGYATYQVGRFAVEGLIKADLFQHTERATVKKQVACEGTDVLIVDSDADLQTAAPRKGEVSENNFTAATNFSYRFDLSGGYWLEPLVGVRYTYTDFGSGADALDLTDGQVLRVQGGLRLGTAQPWQGYTLRRGSHRSRWPAWRSLQVVGEAGQGGATCVASVIGVSMRIGLLQ